MAKNPFGDDASLPERVSPFGEEAQRDAGGHDPVRVLEQAAARVRTLRGRVGGDGLTASDQRQLLDHISDAMDATARALRRLDADPGR